MILTTLIILIALEHLYFLYFEMFAWETIGKRTFRSLPADIFTPTKALAANQGLYNGFLAAGLIWSRLIEDAVWSDNVALFFLICVAIAGIFGAVSASKKIFFVQALPALVAVLLILLTHRGLF
jgi:putative membrane protein